MKSTLKFVLTLTIVLTGLQSFGQSFTLPGDNNWYLVATMSGRHAFIEYIYSHPTGHNPSIVKGNIQFINARTFIIQEQQTMGYNSWNQPQFAIINKSSVSELWVKATSGVSSGPFEIIYSKYANLSLGSTSDSDLSDNGGSLKIYNKLADNSHTYTGNLNVIDGKIGIGTTSYGSHKLAVDGSIGAREIKVEASGWSDFVFEENYELPTLVEVENQIKEKGHLTDIPNESEVKENGINLGEMDAKLLQKIEELTLYLIEQNKELKSQKEQNQVQ